MCRVVGGHPWTHLYTLPPSFNSVGKAEWVTGLCRAYFQWTSGRSLRLHSPASQTAQHWKNIPLDVQRTVQTWSAQTPLTHTKPHQAFPSNPIKAFRPSLTRQASWIFGCRNTLGCCFHHGDTKRSSWKDISMDLQEKGKNTNREDKSESFRLAHGWVWSPEQHSPNSKGRIIYLSYWTLQWIVTLRRH